MKTGIFIKPNDYLDFDEVGVIVNVSLDEDEIETLFYQYSKKNETYYIFQHMIELFKFGMNNEGSSNAFSASKSAIDILKEKPFEGWLIQKLDKI